MSLFAFAKNTRKYGPAVTTYDVIKTLAVVLMIVDHVGYFFFTDELWWRAIGRMSAPIWFFMAGYARPKEASAEIKILAALMVLLDAVTGNTVFPFNVLFSIMLSRWVVEAIDRKQLPSRNFPIVIALLLACYPFSILLFEYGTLAIMFVYAGYLCRTAPGTQNAYLTLGIALPLYLVLQNLGFHFEIALLAVMCGGTIAIGYYLSQFRPRPVLCIPERGVANVLLRFTGRNTLYIYFLHYCAFEIIQTVMHPPENFSIHFFVK